MIKTDQRKVLFLKGEYADGEGTFVYSKRSKYEGHWVSGQRDGYGVHTFSDRSKYIGHNLESSIG